MEKYNVRELSRLYYSDLDESQLAQLIGELFALMAEKRGRTIMDEIECMVTAAKKLEADTGMLGR